MEKRNLLKNLIIRLLLILVGFPIFSQETATSGNSGGPIGLGLSLFSPTGITLKYKLNPQMAIEGSLGSTGSHRYHLHGVFLYRFFELTGIKTNPGLYAGGGLLFQEKTRKASGLDGFMDLLAFQEDRYQTELGLRIPFGVSTILMQNHLELYGELDTHIFLTGDNDLDIGLSFGARYFF